MSEGEDKFDRGSTLSISCGLHVFRYVSYQGGGVPAVAKLIPPGAGVAVLDMPGRDGGVLRAPGDCLVVRADRPSDVVVGLRRGSPDGALDATFRMEPLALTEPIEGVEAPAIAAPAPSFLAHLSSRGDVAFGQNVWAGGPDSPAAVEGLQILGDAATSACELQVLVGSRPPRWSDWAGAGQYAGTRGHGLPLVGFRMRLKPEAAGLEIAAEALFLGALVASQRGRQVEFVSASGVDPLIGVKFAMQTANEIGATRSSGTVDAQIREAEPRVRVFRATNAR